MYELSGFCGGANSIAFTPTAINDIDHVEIQNGMYNDLMVTEATDFTITDSIPDWTYDTVLYAKFTHNTNAGNVDWNLDTVSDLAIKSRPVGTFQWNTITVKPINSLEDFDINFVDYLVPSGQPTEYALVPLLHGVEGVYDSTQITPKYDKIFLIESDMVYATSLIDGGMTVTRNIPSANVELLNSRYPIFVRNTIANYDTGTATGIWIPNVSDTDCDMAEALDPEHDYDRTIFQKEFIDFLADSKPKILKDDMGGLWIVQITPNIENAPGESYSDRKLTFSWVEIADHTSEEDLWYLGLSNVSEEWWSS